VRAAAERAPPPSPPPPPAPAARSPAASPPPRPRAPAVFVCSIFLSLFVAWGIGANDVANAFGSSVGAKALTMKQAIVVAGVCEFLGSVLMGAGVVETIKGGLTKVDAFTETPDLLMYGMMCALLAAGLWLLLATFWELPVSTTHSIVGAVVGMACVASPNGFASVVWYAEPFKKSLVLIVISWILSPVLSAAVAAVFFLITRTAVLRRENSFQKVRSHSIANYRCSNHPNAHPPPPRSPHRSRSTCSRSSALSPSTSSRSSSASRASRASRATRTWTR
jgi:phosphate/sulfate permease